MHHDQTEELRQTDVMDPSRGHALQVALGLAPDIAAGAALPPFFHYLHFWDVHPPTALGRDGHPRVGGVIPDMGLPRRMWAGGDLTFHAPLLAGVPATKVTTVEKAVHKDGRTGPLGFVTLRHTYHQGGQLCVTEMQDLVYREDVDADAPKPAAPQAQDGAEQMREVVFDTTLLFRYSALTFNGHRIHYDLDYARDVEGYAGLVVHGPLLAQMLMLMAEEVAPLKRFTFRATAPLMHFETASLCRAGADMWVRGPDGRQCMVATIET